MFDVNDFDFGPTIPLEIDGEIKLMVIIRDVTDSVRLEET